MSRMSGPLTRLAAPVIAAAFVVASLFGGSQQTASAQAAGEIGGSLPQNGGFAIVVWGGGDAEALVEAASGGGCEAASIWITAQGEFVPYIVGAPAFVNANFVGRWPEGNIPGGTPIIIVCSA